MARTFGKVCLLAAHYPDYRAATNCPAYPLTYSLVTNTGEGTAAVNGGGSATYQLDTDEPRGQQRGETLR